jgi:hypothetical protein
MCETRTVEVPEDLIAEFERRAEITQFETVDEYVTHILQSVREELEPIEHGGSQQEIKARLKSLGYMDQ